MDIFLLILVSMVGSAVVAAFLTRGFGLLVGLALTIGLSMIWMTVVVDSATANWAGAMSSKVIGVFLIIIGLLREATTRMPSRQLTRPLRSS